MAEPIPDIRGPKLPRFQGDPRDIEFVKLLSTAEERLPGPTEEEIKNKSQRHSSSANIPHSRVFQIKIGGSRFALKVFNFFKLEDLRPFVPGGEKLLTDKVVRYHLDPFYAECRAFGLLVQEKKDHRLAVRCHGYSLLLECVGKKIRELFKIDDWHRQAEHGQEKLRAIVKDYIPFKSTCGRKKLDTMRSNLKQLNELGVYNMDIREDNYRGGRLFDFSLAITSPHINLSLKLWSKRQIEEDVKYDLECFESFAKRENEKQAEERKATQPLASGRKLRSHGKETSAI
ncbi:uncharacterized protein PG998_002628 [Apiospora kogelbergensis]|uniref:uncharacterized protein n=1 Tax=Apiospora kogelbergensis TaxID=1337665 RepID=UPI00312E9D63